MWDNAHLLRGIANVLFGFSMLLMVYGVVRYVAQLPAFSLQAVVLTATPQRVEMARLQEVVRDQIHGNFFTVDLAETRAAFQQLPWVRSVSVRRKFPWQLEVVIEEHVALARWNKTAMVNTYGEVFEAETDEQLPAFLAEQENSLVVARMFSELEQELQPLQRHIVQLTLSPRMAWQARLDDGMEIALGREAMRERLARFAKVFPYSVAVRIPNASRIDLRYRNGFAVQPPLGAA
ncbi:MAG: cell division protein FtsQ/DivIB [Gammaproteobacteria bacterium]|nr:cell division protein FtsQ/DivIB [Gammaproteobacteria bacterium]MBU1447393.1 cell division protein FtsQ/DivIB [Gammaproteobacteria bacterium]